VPVPLAATGGRLLDDAGRDGLEAQGVVDADGDPHELAGRRHRADVGLGRRVAALVPDDLLVAHPDRGPVRGRLEVQDDALARPPAGHAHRPLVPDLADVVAQARVDEVVVARGHGHVLRVPERPGEPPLGAPRAVDIEAEPPQPVEGLAFTGRGVLGGAA